MRIRHSSFKLEFGPQFVYFFGTFNLKGIHNIIRPLCTAGLTVDPAHRSSTSTVLSSYELFSMAMFDIHGKTVNTTDSPAAARLASCQVSSPGLFDVPISLLIDLGGQRPIRPSNAGNKHAVLVALLLLLGGVEINPGTSKGPSTSTSTHHNSKCSAHFGLLNVRSVSVDSRSG